MLALSALLAAPMFLAASAADAQPRVLAPPAPVGEALSEDYELTVSGTPVPVYACRVSAVPLNQVWPGYQRPLDQTELAGFASWDMTAGPVRVEIRCRRATPQAVVVRPSSYGLMPTVTGDRITFDLDRPRQLVVEVDGTHHALHLFANPPERDVPAADAPGVRHFGPGVHQPGRIDLQSGQSVYIAAGAVVYGSIQARGATAVRVTGRGILDVGPFERGKGGGAVRFSDCTDVTVEGIVMRDPDVWCASFFGCRNVTVTNAKLVGLWRYNADGIDLCNTQDAVVQDCFLRAFDDAVVLKGLKWGGNDSYHERPVRNIRVRRCVIWCDWGRALEIGAETCAPEISDVVFEDCDVVRTTHIALDIQHGDGAAVHDIRFADIRVEVDAQNPLPKMQATREEVYRDDQKGAYCPTLAVIVIAKNNYSKDEQRGTVRNVLFERIAVTGPREPTSWFRGLDADHTVEGVTIRDLTFNGRPITSATDAHLSLGPNVADVRFAPATP